MRSISEEFYNHNKICDECKENNAHWVVNEDRPFDERVYLCGKCATAYHQSKLS